MKKLIKILLMSIFIISIVLLNLSIAFASERPLRITCSWPIYIDPHVYRDASSSIAYFNLYDPFLISDINGEPQAHVAESWEISDDGLTLTFHIRQGIKFHDGSELTASDVKFSMDRFRTMGKGNASLFLAQKIDVEAVDEYTVKFHLEKPDGTFLQKLVMFYTVNEDLIRANTAKPGSYGEMGDYGTEYLLTHDAGSGPYIVKEVVLESHVSMIVNPNYWIPIDPNAPDEFKMIGTTEAITVRALLSSRELEIGDEYQTLETIESLDKIEGIDIARYTLPYLMNIMINTKRPPTDDIHFRKAMAWATDYESVIKDILPGSSQARGPVPTIIPSHDPTVFQYHRDLDKAMEELKQSKYYEQLDKYPLELHWIAENPVTERLALLFMSNMADIGIKVNVLKVPWLTILSENKKQETSPNLELTNTPAYYPEAASILQIKYGSISSGMGFETEWLLDPEFDAMIDDAIQTVDKDERYAKYNKLQHYIVDLCPNIFLTNTITMRAYQSTYIDWYVATEGKSSPAKAHDFIVRNIKIYPEKKEELLK